MAEIKEDHSFVHLFSSASLSINEDEWTNLVHSDINLAKQVGLLLLKNNQGLELLLDATEKEYKEQRMRADECEHRMKNQNQLLENQSKIYSSLERQVKGLTVNYTQLMDDCLKYKDKNKMLWGRVENLENECDDYLSEIKSLKEQIKTEAGSSSNQITFLHDAPDGSNKNRRNCSVPDDRINAFSSQRRRSTQTQHQPDRKCSTIVDNMLFYRTTLEENQKLKKKIDELENQMINNMIKDAEYIDGKAIETNHRLNSDDENESLNDVFFCENNKTDYQRQTSTKKTTEYFKCSNHKKVKENLGSLPTVRHYHELFAEIFAKLQETRTEP